MLLAGRLALANDLPGADFAKKSGLSFGPKNHDPDKASHKWGPVLMKTVSSDALTFDEPFESGVSTGSLEMAVQFVEGLKACDCKAREQFSG